MRYDHVIQVLNVTEWHGENQLYGNVFTNLFMIFFKYIPYNAIKFGLARLWIQLQVENTIFMSKSVALISTYKNFCSCVILKLVCLRLHWWLIMNAYQRVSVSSIISIIIYNKTVINVNTKFGVETARVKYSNCW